MRRYGSHTVQGHLVDHQHKGPRTVRVARTDRGFGFTLRHFIVYPPEPKDFQKPSMTSSRCKQMIEITLYLHTYILVLTRTIGLSMLSTFFR
ncbi:Rho GTPase-activating protein 21 [Mactra antiquata]